MQRAKILIFDFRVCPIFAKLEATNGGQEYRWSSASASGSEEYKKPPVDFLRRSYTTKPGDP